MKKSISIFLALAAATGLVSCNKNAPVASGEIPEAVPDASITVNIGMEEEGTKAPTAQVKDYQINRVQVFVFNADNKLETSFFEGGLTEDTSYSVKIATFTGPKTVYVIVNHNRITKFKPHTTTITNLEAELVALDLHFFFLMALSSDRLNSQDSTREESWPCDLKLNIDSIFTCIKMPQSEYVQ